MIARGAKLSCAALVLALAASGCDHSHAAVQSQASPLGVVSATTPRFRVAGFETAGTYPRFRDASIELHAVNRALRDAILADQRAFAPTARRYAGNGYYETELDRTLISASSVVVSVLIPRARALLPLRPGSDGWLALTVRVPSGARVTLQELFARRAQAMRVIEARVRRDRFFDTSVRRNPAGALRNDWFAVLPSGLAVGVVGAANRDEVIVPYRALRPYLSLLGLTLAAGARWPDYRPDRAHFSYCRRVGLSLSELSATGDVPCATARKVEATVFSRRCVSRNRCSVSGFTCLAVWDGRYDRPFEFTHHAICHDGARQIDMDEG